MKRFFRLIARLMLAGIVLVVGGYLLYAFGAGYFSNLGIGAPTPLNIMITVSLGFLLVRAAARIVMGRLSEPSSP